MKTLPIIFISLLLLLFACNSDSEETNTDLNNPGSSSSDSDNINLDIESNKEDINSLIEWSNSMIEFSNAQSNTIEELTLEVQELKEKVIQLKSAPAPAAKAVVVAAPTAAPTANAVAVAAKAAPAAMPSETEGFIGSAGDFLDELKQNTVVATLKYKEKEVTITGKIYKIDFNYLGEPYISVTASSSDIHEVHCMIIDSSQLAGLSANDNVTVVGKFDELSGFYAMLENCSVK